MEFKDLPKGEDILNMIGDALTPYDIIRIEHGEEVVDTEKLEAFHKILEIAQESIKGTDNQIGYGMFEPFPYSGFITISGKQLDFKSIQKISDVAKYISNIEVFDISDGGVSVSLTFNCVKQKVIK